MQFFKFVFKHAFRRTVPDTPEYYFCIARTNEKSPALSLSPKHVLPFFLRNPFIQFYHKPPIYLRKLLLHRGPTAVGAGGRLFPTNSIRVAPKKGFTTAAAV